MPTLAEKTALWLDCDPGTDSSDTGENRAISDIQGKGHDVPNHSPIHLIHVNA